MRARTMLSLRFGMSSGLYGVSVTVQDRSLSGRQPSGRRGVPLLRGPLSHVRDLEMIGHALSDLLGK